GNLAIALDASEFEQRHPAREEAVRGHRGQAKQAAQGNLTADGALDAQPDHELPPRQPLYMLVLRAWARDRHSLHSRSGGRAESRYRLGALVGHGDAIAHVGAEVLDPLELERDRAGAGERPGLHGDLLRREELGALADAEVL